MNRSKQSKPAAVAKLARVYPTYAAYKPPSYLQYFGYDLVLTPVSHMAEQPHILLQEAEELSTGRLAYTHHSNMSDLSDASNVRSVRRVMGGGNGQARYVVSLAFIGDGDVGHEQAGQRVADWCREESAGTQGSAHNRYRSHYPTRSHTYRSSAASARNSLNCHTNQKRCKKINQNMDMLINVDEDEDGDRNYQDNADTHADSGYALQQVARHSYFILLVLCAATITLPRHNRYRVCITKLLQQLQLSFTWKKTSTHYKAYISPSYTHTHTQNGIPAICGRDLESIAELQAQPTWGKDDDHVGRVLQCIGHIKRRNAYKHCIAYFDTQLIHSLLQCQDDQIHSQYANALAAMELLYAVLSCSARINGSASINGSVNSDACTGSNLLTHPHQDNHRYGIKGIKEYMRAKLVSGPHCEDGLQTSTSRIETEVDEQVRQIACENIDTVFEYQLQHLMAQQPCMDGHALYLGLAESMSKHVPISYKQMHIIRLLLSHILGHRPPMRNCKCHRQGEATHEQQQGSIGNVSKMLVNSNSNSLVVLTSRIQSSHEQIAEQYSRIKQPQVLSNQSDKEIITQLNTVVGAGCAKVAQAKQSVGHIQQNTHALADQYAHQQYGQQGATVGTMQQQGRIKCIDESIRQFKQYQLLKQKDNQIAHLMHTIQTLKAQLHRRPIQPLVSINTHATNPHPEAELPAPMGQRASNEDHNHKYIANKIQEIKRESMRDSMRESMRESMRSSLKVSLRESMIRKQPLDGMNNKSEALGKQNSELLPAGKPMKPSAVQTAQKHNKEEDSKSTLNQTISQKSKQDNGKGAKNTRDAKIDKGSQAQVPNDKILKITSTGLRNQANVMRSNKNLGNIAHNKRLNASKNNDSQESLNASWARTGNPTPTNKANQKASLRKSNRTNSNKTLMQN